MKYYTKNDLMYWGESELIEYIIQLQEMIKQDIFYNTTA